MSPPRSSLRFRRSVRGAAFPLCHALAVFAVALVTCLPLAGQNAIGGIVVDASSGQPLSGVQIAIPGTGQGVLSQSNGRFLISDVRQGTVTLEVVMLGYRTWRQDVAVGNTDLVIRMDPRAVELDALVVTGTAGEQQARSLGNVVGTIRADQLNQLAPPPDMESLLSGTMPGVNVAVGGGEVGGGANIRIRGASSISLNSQPLVYVDGIRVNGDNADQGGGIGGVGVDFGVPPSRLNDINPDDIESVEVIKGPAAATLYGTEASNGVINVITKKGDRGSARFTLTVKQGANWIADPEEYFPETHFRCQGTSGTCQPGEIVAFNVLREDRIRNGNEWFQTGRPMSYGGSVSGGTDDLRYYFSGDWDRDEGIVDYNWKNQLTGRANLNWTPRQDVDIQFGISGVRSRYESPSANQPVTTAILWSCPAPGCEEGSGLSNAVDGAFRGYIGYLPEVLADSVEGLQSVNRTTYNATATHRPTDWFTHRFTWGADWTETNNTQLYRPINGPGHFVPQGAKSAQRQTAQFISTDYSATATWEPTADVSLATSGGMQFYQKELDWIFASGSIFAVPTLETVSAGSQKSAEEGFVENKTLGAYLQEQLSWRNRIFLTGAVRGDDNSAFGENFDFVVYPKVSASWVISEEPFLQGRDWVSQLKLRGAWGQAGQQPDVFAALRTYEPAVGSGGASTLRPENVGNPDLEPEVGEELELGFDGTFFQDRVSVQFTFYDQVRQDAIVQVPVRPSVGFPGIQFRNIGEVTNRGFELGLDANVWETAGWDLDMALNLSTNDNELVNLGGLPPQILQGQNPTTGNAGQMYVEGFPLGAIFLKRVVSADIEGSGADARAVNVMCEGGATIPGASNLSRGGGAAVPCGEAPRLFRGSPVPTREASLSTTLTIGGNLQLFTQVDYQGGHTMVNGNAAGAHLFFRNTRAVLERTDPIFLAYESLGREGINQAGLIDASFAKLRRVSATYTVPAGLVGNLGADRLSLTLSAHNLWTVWQATDEMFGYPIRDPEQRNTSGTSTDPGGLSAYVQEAWSPIKRLLLTARVTF
ncbi:MAG: SusC/RagA family TonB-linked outer membrane protein [Gemmatimonadetes bacterium]|nr:SusC/RagA family TonB-linked outer membrane protein [Gemmatimonadota bacterium]